METAIVYWGYMGIMGEFPRICYIRVILELDLDNGKQMEITIMGHIGFRV